ARGLGGPAPSRTPDAGVGLGGAVRSRLDLPVRRLLRLREALARVLPEPGPSARGAAVDRGQGGRPHLSGTCRAGTPAPRTPTLTTVLVERGLARPLDLKPAQGARYRLLVLEQT